MATSQGPIESATRALIRDLGSLSAAQLLSAEQALRLAALLDRTGDGTKAAALSRRLDQTVASLTEGARRPQRDEVGRLRDELAAKRRRRNAG